MRLVIRSIWLSQDRSGRNDGGDGIGQDVLVSGSNESVGFESQSNTDLVGGVDKYSSSCR